MKKIILTEEQKNALHKFNERRKKAELNQTFKCSKKAE